jgi:hypothetical protein
MTHSSTPDNVPTAHTPKSAANRKNALKSTGPKTLRGKGHSRGNSLKHGFYSRELLVSEADAPELHDMYTALEAEAKPETKFQELAFDHVIACFWRTKIAARIEGRQFARKLEDGQHGHSEHESPDPDAGFERWYYSRGEAHAGIRALAVAMTEFDSNGYFRDETRNFLKCSFGPDLLRLLEEWTPTMSMTAMHLAEHLAKHQETYGKMPNSRVDLSSDATKLVVDPRQSRHMVLKLLQERANFLKDSLIITSRNTLRGARDSTQTSDFNPHLVRDAHRELQRALEAYRSLREHGL